MTATSVPVDSEAASELREAEQDVTLSARCRAARPVGASLDAWTEPNVLRCRGEAIRQGVPEARADAVMVALASDGTVISPTAVHSRRLLKKARSVAAGRSPGKSIPPWCGHCDPAGKRQPRRRWRETADGVPFKCPECHPSLLENA